MLQNDCISKHEHFVSKIFMPRISISSVQNILPYFEWHCLIFPPFIQRYPLGGPHVLFNILCPVVHGVNMSLPEVWLLSILCHFTLKENPTQKFTA